MIRQFSISYFAQWQQFNSWPIYVNFYWRCFENQKWFHQNQTNRRNCTWNVWASTLRRKLFHYFTHASNKMCFVRFIFNTNQNNDRNVCQMHNLTIMNVFTNQHEYVIGLLNSFMNIADEIHKTIASAHKLTTYSDLRAP